MRRMKFFFDKIANCLFSLLSQGTISRAEHPFFFFKFAVHSLLNFSHRSKTTLIVHFPAFQVSSLLNCSLLNHWLFTYLPTEMQNKTRGPDLQGGNKRESMNNGYTRVWHDLPSMMNVDCQKRVQSSIPAAGLHSSSQMSSLRQSKKYDTSFSAFKLSSL